MALRGSIFTAEHYVKLGSIDLPMIATSIGI